MAGEASKGLKQNIQLFLCNTKLLGQSFKGLIGDKGEIARRMDMLKFQIDEIKLAKLKKGEDESLNKQRQVLANSEKNMEFYYKLL